MAREQEEERAKGHDRGEEQNETGKKQTEDSKKKDKQHEDSGEAPPDIEQPAPVSSRGRTYYFTVPIRPMSGQIPEEFLERLTLYYSLYGIVFAIVGAIAIVLPLVFGVGVEALVAWLLVLGGSVTLLMFLLICGAPGTTAFCFLSALHLAAGIYLLIRPPSTISHLLLLLAGWFILHGVLKIIMAISVRKITTWPVVLVSGIISMVLAFVILALTSKVGLELVSITFGADLALTGVSLLLIAIMGFLGKGSRSVSDADLINEPLLGGGGHAATSA
ncbi:unnamed protein product [Calypogeia fissa]